MWLFTYCLCHYLFPVLSLMVLARVTNDTSFITGNVILVKAVLRTLRESFADFTTN